MPVTSPQIQAEIDAALKVLHGGRYIPPVTAGATPAPKRDPQRANPIPAELRDRAQWVGWKSIPEPSKPKPKKLLIDPRTGNAAKSNDPQTWADYDSAAKCVARYRLHQSADLPGGVGFVFTESDSFCGVDLDHCRDKETGSIEPWAQGIINRIGSYSEVSPSGTGVKVFLRGKLPANTKHNVEYQTGSVEVYDKLRFFTVTGEHLAGTPATVEARQGELTAVYADVFGKVATAPSAQSAPAARETIGAGHRTPLLSSLIGKLHSKGTPRDGILEAALALNKTFDPPLPETKVTKMIEDMCLRYSPGDLDGRSVPPQYADDSLSLKFTGKHGENLRYTSAWGRWSKWTGNRWERDETLAVFDLARDTCREESTACEDKRIAARIASAQTVSAVERLARADRRHAAVVEQWDVDPWVLNTPGGLVDLRTGGSRPSRREDYITKLTAVAPRGDCTIWRKFLERVTDGKQELVDFLQRMCGYALTGVTREHAMFFLFGTGANGKSVFVNTMLGVFGDYAKTAPIETFIDSKNQAHPTDVASLQGARLVTAVETEDGRRWAESKLKALTGGDRIAARYMRQDFFEFSPAFKLVVAGNHKPGLRSVDEAIKRRFNLVPFTVTIPAAERDPELAEKLKAEWPGILQWAVDGCLAWQRDGLNTPAVVEAATREYFAAEDALSRWLEERTELKPGFWENASDLFRNWKEWAESGGEFVGSQKRFSESLASKGVAQVRKKTGRGFEGIRLRGSVVMDGETTTEVRI